MHTIVDQQLFGPDSGTHLHRTVAGIIDAHAVCPHVPSTNPYLRFVHFCDYPSTYYGYLYSQAIAAAVWSRHFEQDPFDQQSGEGRCFLANVACVHLLVTQRSTRPACAAGCGGEGGEHGRAPTSPCVQGQLWPTSSATAAAGTFKARCEIWLGRAPCAPWSMGGALTQSNSWRWRCGGGVATRHPCPSSDPRTARAQEPRN